MADFEEDFFSDDGFDDLPAETLLELERNAIQSTQHQPSAVGQNQLRSDAPPRQLPGERVYQARSRPQARANSDYGDFDFGDASKDADADVLYDGGQPVPLGLEAQWLPGQKDSSEVAEREQFRQNRYGSTSVLQAAATAAAFTNRITTDKPTPAIEEASNLTYYNEAPSYNPYDYNERDEDVEMLDGNARGAAQQQAEGLDHSNVDDLASEVVDLRKEAAQLRAQLESAQSTIFAKTGEIAIVRLNQEKATKSYEQQLAAVRQSAAADIARNKAALEAKMAESGSVADEIRFLKQDLAEESKRVETLQRTLKDKEKAVAAAEAKAAPLTPKKVKDAQSFRDGFDDDEIDLASPSRSGRRSKKGTPNAGAKRKRNVVQDEPIPMTALELSHEMELPVRLTPAEMPPATPPIPPPVVPKEQHNLRFVSKILNFRPSSGKTLLVEALTSYSFPSMPSKHISSNFLERLGAVSGEKTKADVTRIFLSLWEQALQEKFFKPISLFIDVVTYILDLEGPEVVPGLIKEIISVAQRSARINGYVRHLNSPVSSRNFLKKTPKSELNADVDGTACLQILYSSAAYCLHDEESLKLFWQTMPLDFVLMMIGGAQPIADLSVLVNLLALSIMPTTFGPIAAEEERQVYCEHHVLEQLTCLLNVDPLVDEGEPEYTRTQICQFRLDILSFLFELGVPSIHPHTKPTHGSQLIAIHDRVLGRLVRAMYDELDILYSHPPEHILRSTIINNATRLVFHIFQLHGDMVDLQAKMAAITMGKHKHLVVLARLAFSEGPLLEAGIEDETVEMAHELLDRIVGPQEADALFDVFPARRDVSMSG